MGKRLIKFIAICISLVLASLCGALIFGTSKPPEELRSVSNPFRATDFSDLPDRQTLKVAHGDPIAFRVYGQAQSGVVIALHGSTGQGASLHPLSKGIAAGGFAVYAPDLRGHGATGRRGDVDYIGQPDDDLKALVAHVRSTHPDQPLVLLGFSLGGGFALKFLGSYPEVPISRAVLVAPALGRGAPTMKTTGDDWASPHIPRIIALTILNRIGVTAFNGLEVITYAVPQGSENVQTGSYSYRLLQSLLPQDYRGLAANVKGPLIVMTGEKDELFDAGKMVEAFKDFDRFIRTITLPSVSHVGATTNPEAIDVLVKTLLQSKN